MRLNLKIYKPGFKVSQKNNLLINQKILIDDCLKIIDDSLLIYDYWKLHFV
jgi:hypothetical protein